MHIIYHCFGGSHSSVTAACLHAGLLKDNKIPTREELMKLPFYDKQTGPDHGYIRFIGEDSWGNKIYLTSRHNLEEKYEDIIDSIADIMKINKQEFILVSTMPYVNILMVIGGYTSRRLGWVKIGRPIVVRGTQLAFSKFVHLVNLIKFKYGR